MIIPYTVNIIVAVTGHRPSKLGGYSPVVFDRLTKLAESFITKYIEGKYSPTIITGMALGWDQAVAQACINKGVPFVAAIPCPGQASRWPAASVAKWKQLVDQASGYHVISSSYSVEAMHRRNAWMVDRCEHLVALWDGSSGGTSNCVRYAMNKNIPIDNLWKEWSGE